MTKRGIVTWFGIGVTSVAVFVLWLGMKHPLAIQRVVDLLEEDEEKTDLFI